MTANPNEDNRAKMLLRVENKREQWNLHFDIITIESTANTTAQWKVKFENDNDTQKCSNREYQARECDDMLKVETVKK